MQVEPSVQKLYDYIYERGTIVPVEDYSMELLSHGDISRRVTESIRCANSLCNHLQNALSCKCMRSLPQEGLSETSLRLLRKQEDVLA